MTKLDIIKKISSETGFTNVEVELFLDSFINSIKTSLSKGEKIEIRGFGSFITKKRNARKARNPLTNEIVDLDDRYIPFFKVSKIPSTALYPKKSRGPAIGGTSHSPASYRTGPGHIRNRDPGSLQGNSKPHRDDFDDGERVFNLSDMIEPENKVVIRVRKMVRDILSADSDE